MGEQIAQLLSTARDFPSLNWGEGGTPPLRLTLGLRFLYQSDRTVLACSSQMLDSMFGHVCTAGATPAIVDQYHTPNCGPSAVTSMEFLASHCGSSGDFPKEASKSLQSSFGSFGRHTCSTGRQLIG